MVKKKEYPKISMRRKKTERNKAFWISWSIFDVLKITEVFKH